MRALITGRLQRKLVTSLMLVAMVFRALVPIGFMPSAERPFSLQICPAGMVMPHDAATPGKHSSHVEHCYFGSAPGSGPLSSLLQIPRTGLSTAPSIAHFATLRLGTRLDRAHAARAPPALA